MIVSKNWLNDWIDIHDKNLEELSKALNSIGIEVDKAYVLRVPDKIVIGLIKEKIKHENSDKLSICQVDIGNETLQIVCGASNATEGKYVAVALNGAIMPNGMQIKKAKFRGVESCGMLCSSTELGFAKINEGIMFLDESIGKLELGRALNSYAIFNDCFMEVEITPNRGDCLGIYGIARDLAAYFNLNLKENIDFKEPENTLGIGNILRLQAQKKLNSFFNFRAIDIKEKFEFDLLINLRLASIGSLNENMLENLLEYASHSTGVVFNAYNFKKLAKDEEKIIIKLSKETNGETKLTCQEDFLSISGIYQGKDKKVQKDDLGVIIIEANYTEPQIIANAKNSYKEWDEKILYRSSRGSETKLDFGMQFLLKTIENNPNITIYTSSQQILDEREFPLINLDIKTIDSIAGQEFDKDKVLKILKNLGFEIILSGEELINVKAPPHRADIKNIADICEEIIRIIGIDNIEAKALEFNEKNRINQTYVEYKKLLKFRNKAVDSGYFESLHYVLDNEIELKELGFTPTKLKLLNPITAELNTLRSTLLNHLLNAASFNAKNSKKIIKLFESGSIFDENNEEKFKIAFVSSGYKEEPKISNKAKPELVNFYDFLSELKNIIGDFKLQKATYEFLSPYEQVFLYKNDQKIGFAGRLHQIIENKRSLLKTYVCELDSSMLKEDFKIAKAYSKFPGISRDFSVLVPKDYDYEKIKNTIESLDLENLESFRLIDLYDDESLGQNYSLTINFVFKSLDRTLEEVEISACMDKILKALEDLGLSLR